jgi:hypothetical protein
MMQTIKINEGQTLLDIAVQYNGDAAKAFELALANSLNFSDDLIIGNEVLVESAAVEKKKLVKEFDNNKIVPSSKKDNYENLQPEGVDYWAIGTEFIIS